MDDVPGVYDASQRESHLREFAETVRRSRQEDDPGYILDDAMGEMQGILMGSPDDPRRDKATRAVRQLEWLYDRLATAGGEVTQMVATAYWAGRLAEQAIIMEIDPVVRTGRKQRGGTENSNAPKREQKAEETAGIQDRYKELKSQGASKATAVNRIMKEGPHSRSKVYAALKGM